MPEALIQKFVENQFCLNPNCILDHVYKLCRKTQLHLLGRYIWDRGAAMAVEDALPIVSLGMACLTRIQRTQFILMNGNCGLDLFLALTPILNLCRFEDLSNLCGLRPDSFEIESLTKHLAYIELFGKLGSGSLFGR